MQDVTDKFLSVARRGGTSVTKVEAWYDGVQLDLDTLAGNVPIYGGIVVDDGSRTGVRRTMSLTTDASLWGALNAPRVLLKAYRGWRYVDGSVEYAALGVFTIDEDKRGYQYSGEDTITLTCPDRWATVQRSRFEAPRVGTTSAVSQAVTWVTECFTTDVPTTDVTASSTVSAVDQVYDRDRAAAIAALAKAGAFEIYFDAAGVVTARDAPTIDDPVVWVANTGTLGVVLNAQRSRSVQRVYNVVVVSGEDVDGSPPFTPVVLADEDPTSPTFVGTSTTPGIGRIPYFYASALLLNTTQANAAAQSLFARVRLPAMQLEFDQVVNPALESGDVVQVVLSDGSIERHLIERINTPLMVDGVQEIIARSTRAEDDGGEV